MRKKTSKSKKVDVIQRFMLGEAYCRINTRKGFNDFCNMAKDNNPNVSINVPEWMISDFGKNKINDGYFLAYFIGGNAINCCTKEFFDYTFRTNVPFGDSKTSWFEM